MIPSPAPQAVSTLLFIAFPGLSSYKYKTNEAEQMKKQATMVLFTLPLTSQNYQAQTPDFGRQELPLVFLAEKKILVGREAGDVGRDSFGFELSFIS